MTLMLFLSEWADTWNKNKWDSYKYNKIVQLLLSALPFLQIETIDYTRWTFSFCADDCQREQDEKKSKHKKQIMWRW